MGRAESLAFAGTVQGPLISAMAQRKGDRKRKVITSCEVLLNILIFWDVMTLINLNIQSVTSLSISMGCVSSLNIFLHRHCELLNRYFIYFICLRGVWRSMQWTPEDTRKKRDPCCH